MTGLKVACLSLLVLIAVPVASARTEFSADESREIDAMQVEASLYAGIADGNDVAVEREFAWVDAAYMVRYIPNESEILAFFESFFAALPQQEVPDAPVVDASAPDPQSEVDALMAQGIGSQGRTHATNQEVEVAAQAHAGSQTQSASASARPADEIPVERVEGLTSFGSSPDEAAAEEEVADEVEPEPVADTQSTPIAPEGIATLAGDEQAIIQPISLPAALATTAAVIGVSTTTAFAALPGWRSALTRVLRRFGWMVLFSRIAQEDILNHERRSELLEYVRNNAGERVEVARRALGFSNGSMHYHLRVLQDRGLVKILKEGSLARLYPRGPKIQPVPYVPAQRKRFLEVLSTEPGKTQRELSLALGLSERMVSYHVQALASQGLLEVRAEGARKRLFPSQAPTAPAVLAPAA